MLNSSPWDPRTVTIGCAEPEPTIVTRCVPEPEMSAAEAVKDCLTTNESADEAVSALTAKEAVEEKEAEIAFST